MLALTATSISLSIEGPCGGKRVGLFFQGMFVDEVSLKKKKKEEAGSRGDVWRSQETSLMVLSSL